MCIYYLYVKTHNITGLKYLGQTKKQDPHAYNGSGILWSRHLRKYGKDYSTTILAESASLDEIKKLGLYYSEKWDIVQSVEWANLKVEDGTGGSNKEALNRPEVKAKRAATIAKPEVKAKISKSQAAAQNRPESKLKQSIAHTGKQNGRYDHTIYHFYHISGLNEQCTRYDLQQKYNLTSTANMSKLIHGRYLSYAGWSLR